MKIQLEPYEAAQIAELLLLSDQEAREIKVQWAVKLIKAITPAPAPPVFEKPLGSQVTGMQ